VSCWGLTSKIRDADGGGPLLSRSRRIDIRQLDFVALKAAGYRGAVVDKDNCLVSPSSILDSARSRCLNSPGNVPRLCLITMSSCLN
jgi:hypothetical protein